jgi:hypothetical protein
VTKHVCEIVRWKALHTVADADMVLAVEAIVPDLMSIGGFVSKTLYRDGDSWVDIYMWKTRGDAESSMGKMSEKGSFQTLMSMIDPSSVSLTILEPV